MNSPHTPAILIVEDDRLIATDLQQTLRDMGYDAYAIAASAEEALACAAARRPDVVLMDIRIRGAEDGIATAELLRKKYPVSLIYLTAHSDEAMLDRAKRTEPQGYLLKPVKSGELRSMIEISVYKREMAETRAKLRASEQRLGAITDNVPFSIAYFDRAGRVQFANRVFRELLHANGEAAGASAEPLAGGALYKQLYVPRQAALAGEQTYAVMQVQYDGRLQKHQMTFFPDRDERGDVAGVYAIGYDVTEREQLTADLKQARLDLETILNAMPAGITSWRIDLRNRFANRSAEAQRGLAPGAVRGMTLPEYMGAERYREALPVVTAALAGERAAHDFVEPGADGGLRYRYDEYIPEVRDGAVIGLYALSTDVTALRRSHEQIRDLAQRLESVREEERRKVAVILHDGIAQDLFAMKLELKHFQGKLKRNAAVKKMCQELSAAIMHCMDDTRQLANDLRPVALGYFSVATVIREHARNFAGYSQLAVQVSENAEFPALDESMKLLFYRAAQEALTNVARHADAQAVEISFHSDAARITMAVSDDGIGISEGALYKPRSLGILALKERFAALGGGLTLSRREPRGTTFSVYLPTAAANPAATSGHASQHSIAAP